MFEVMLGGSNEPKVDSKFIREVPASEFITGDALAYHIGLTAGIAQHTDSPWLHFVLDGKTLYVAKKPYRHSVSWNHINAAGAVRGSRTVTINGSVYKVRLLKSVATGDIYAGGAGFDPVGTYGSEWNRLMYPIHSGKHTDAGNPSPVSKEGIRFGTLAQYTDTDLLVHHTVGNGSYSWCQETPSSSTGSRICRGHFGVSYLTWSPTSNVNSAYGWRPVLELIP